MTLSRPSSTTWRALALTASLFGLLLLAVSPATAAEPCDDGDGDLVCDTSDNCLEVANADQSDIDGDGQGDVCDPCIADPLDDQDGDGVCGNLDRCPNTRPDDEPRHRWAFYLGADEYHFYSIRDGESDRWTVELTGGCSCKQLKNRLEAGSAYQGNHFVGCSKDDMKQWARIIRRTACEPSCGERTCGFDGCNGLCGTCDGDEACIGGDCQVPDPCSRVVDCDDGDVCTTDHCEPGVGCVHAPAAGGTPCDDANACTGGDRCVDGRCVGDALDLCAVADGCTTWSCDPVSGPVEEALPDGAACDPAPGDICVAGVCQDGVCLEAPGLSCDDGDACTSDDCDPATGCVHTLIGCSDGDACTDDLCDPAVGCTTSTRDCDDLDACTEDGCDPDTGCTHATVTCDDADDCTDDFCDPAVGCVYEPSPLCGSESCCEAHTTPSCEDIDVAACVCDLEPSCCESDWHPICADLARYECGADCGCEPTPEVCDGLDNDCDGVIDDGDVCGCDPAACDDGDPCTIDGCNALGACVHDFDPACVCPNDCDDDDICTLDWCHPGTGTCQHDPDPGCEPGSDCCGAHEWPGCESPSVTECVCAVAPECCEEQWYPHCADIAVTDCGLECGACEPTPEICDGIDNDCDGVVDGPGVCGCEPMPEVCDGIDNDCDGVVDGPDVCGCEPMPEVCDGIDNDCDGVVDNDGVCECDPALCDDGDPCTIDRCYPFVGCLHDVDPACACPGGCDDGDGCTHDWCDAGTGTCRFEPEPGCEPDSDCCRVHEWGWCASPTISECVCATAPDCCDDQWGPHCVDLATECGVDCAACEPSPEVCDGLDNDCDGVADGPGVCLCDGVTCDDGDACTHDWCVEPTGECQHAILPECACPDGCDDGDNCTYDWCNTVSGACSHDPEPGCEPDSDCCRVHDWGWCASPTISECVCETAPDCCDDQWGPHCVDLATECGVECAACEPSPEVCDGLDNDCDGVVDDGGACECDPAACDDGDPCTNDGCQADGACFNEPIPGCGGPSDCCEEHTYPGCDDPDVMVCVCDDFPECCEEEWLPHCADHAVNGCGLDCDGGCVPSPEVCDGLDNDCDGVIDGGGVCGCDPAACDDGDPCTNDVCQADGACFHEPIPGCGGSSDCCEAHSWPGCDDPDVMVCVCDDFPECCDEEWLPHCADHAVNGCGLDCGGGCVPSPEVCDGLDNDCDGVIDNGGAEVCDSLDNDCDGLIDEDVCTCEPTLCPPGACEDDDPCTQDLCDPNTGACVHVAVAGCCVPEPEVCDGLDNDCDGVIDDGDVCGCPVGACDDGDPCTIDSCDPVTGACSNDLDPTCSDCCTEHDGPSCSDPAVESCVCDIAPECCLETWYPHCGWIAADECAAQCTGGCEPTGPEVCDGIDNDCDGIVDGPDVCAGPCEVDGTLCDDGDPCTGDDTCVAGECVGALMNCDDGDPCTIDACSPLFGGCNNSPDPDCGCVPEPEICDGIDNDCDGVVDGADVCGCDPLACDDDDPCTSDDCAADGACINTPIPGCGGTSDCCEAHPFPGCEDPDVLACVCADFPECCDAEWLPHCADHAMNGCGLECGGGCVPSPEVCDGLDNDCDGVIDNGDVCGCEPTPEVCDGLDNDCDGVIDDGDVCGCPVGACDDGDPCTIDSCDPVTGACSNDLDPTCSDCCTEHDEPSCSDPAVESCVCDIAPECCLETWYPHCGWIAADECAAQCNGGCEPTGPEVCDGIDNDCDGVTDGPDVCAGPCEVDGAICDDGDPCTGDDTCVAGECVGALMTCDDGDPCTIDACSPLFGGCNNSPDPDCGCVPEPEICGDGLDNDCDGIPDNPEQCGCLPEPELCGDGVDNDCDGVVDNPEQCGTACPIDGAPCNDGDPCTTSDVCLGGECVGATEPELCGDGLDNDCDGVVDNPEQCGCLPEAEVCDGLDNDCDGLVDEDLPPEGPCDSDDADQCQLGTFECIGGAYTCVGDAPQEEVCDGLDNDCDGFVDELTECEP